LDTNEKLWNVMMMMMMMAMGENDGHQEKSMQSWVDTAMRWIQWWITPQQAMMAMVDHGEWMIIR
jgi:hypothetical protein